MVAGHVQQLAVHSEGAVVVSAQTLLVIVQEDAALEVEARVANRDIGRLGPDQEVAIKIDAFDFTTYGLATGRIRTLSRDAVAPAEAAPDVPAAQHLPEPVYLARIRLDRNRVSTGEMAAELAPGMGVTVEIKTGKRRVIDYLLSPVVEHVHDSLREL